MLTLHPARAADRAHTQCKIGLAIGGGGPLGAVYELGALRALDESVEGLRLHHLDVYVGVSAGAFIAASLANGISTAELCRIFMGEEYARLRFEPERFLRPAYREYLDRAVGLPKIISGSLMKMIQSPGKPSLSQLIGELGKAVPSGVFNNETIHDFLEAAFDATGHSNDFANLDCELYVVAVDLDSGAAVRFGGPEHCDVTISRAVQASAALPGLYPPVEIKGRYYVDGALRRTLHASVALDEGVDLLLAINPLVPFSAADKAGQPRIQARKLIQGGLPMILSQTFRALIQSRMNVAFQKYLTSHAQADLVLLEPDPWDEQIFFTNIFSYSSRNALCEHAYQVTRRSLLEHHAEFEPILATHGMSLRMDLLKDQDRSLKESLGAVRNSHAPAARNLSDTLEELEEILRSQRAAGAG
jgi:predicted acylesterase/phospholipase RssA